jgi:hypothetical protein
LVSLRSTGPGPWNSTVGNRRNRKSVGANVHIGRLLLQVKRSDGDVRRMTTWWRHRSSRTRSCVRAARRRVGRFPKLRFGSWTAWPGASRTGEINQFLHFAINMTVCMKYS